MALPSEVWLRLVAVIVSAFSLIAAGVCCSTGVFWSIPSTLLKGTSATSGVALSDSFGNLGGYVWALSHRKTERGADSFAPSLVAIAVWLVLAMPQLKYLWKPSRKGSP
ncbi:hypothetical protein ACVW1C_002645 [Bradyrhizobium sp. USDA 4011]